MRNTLRFAIVGAGVIGPTHAEAIARLADAELVAVVDEDRDRALTLAQRFGASAYGDMQAMLDREQPDVANVCTPSGRHGEGAVRAMRAGCHVIVEKPMEITLPAIDEMLRVQKEMGVKLAVISQHRFDSAAQQVRALAEQGAFGRLVLGNAHIPWWRSQRYYDSGDWRGTWALDGGGVLMNQSIHSIDLLQWFMGPVRSVVAYTGTLVHRMETEDVAVGILRFENGALGTIAATTGAYPGVTTRIEVFGDRGSAVIENDQLGYLHLARGEADEVGDYGASPEAQTDSTERAAGVGSPAISADAHTLQIADMIRAIREDGTPLVDGHAARRPVAIILAVYESANTGKEVVLS